MFLGIHMFIIPESDAATCARKYWYHWAQRAPVSWVVQMMCSRPVSIGIVPECTLVVWTEVLQKVLTCNLDMWVWSVTTFDEQNVLRWDSTITVGIPMVKVESYTLRILDNLNKYWMRSVYKIHLKVSLKIHINKITLWTEWCPKLLNELLEVN